MKIIINESQLNYIFEQTNPCPKGVKVSPLYTIKDLEKGQKLSKGYCIQTQIQLLLWFKKNYKKRVF